MDNRWKVADNYETPCDSFAVHINLTYMIDKLTKKVD